MAASQYLHPGSLLDSLRSCFSPDLVKGASSLIGAPESSTRQALNAAAPTMLGGLTNMASSTEGASTLTDMIHDGDYHSVVDNAGSLFAGGSKTSSMMSIGQQLVGKVFGNRSSSIAETLGRSSGLSSTSASSLLSLVAPLALGVVGKQAMAGGLNASGLRNMLLGQKDQIAAAMPSGMSQVMGMRPELSAVPSPSELRQRAEPSTRKWLPLLLVALAALGLFLFARSRMARRGADVASRSAGAVTGALSNLTLPGGASLSVPEGSISYNLARFLGDTSQGTPKTFVFDHLNFETGSTQLTPDSMPTIQNLVAIMKAYPNAKFQIAGYTDNTGAADANLKLSQDRAETVKSLLVNGGISADRIAAAGFGQENPLAPNDTEEGRAKNRRTELTVTQR